MRSSSVIPTGTRQVLYQVHATDQKQQKEIRQLRVLSFDMFGMLFGDFERALRYMGAHPKGGYKYTRFLLAKQKDLKCVLMNIEGFLDSLEYYYKKANKLGLQDFGPSQDALKIDLPIWQECLERAKKLGCPANVNVSKSDFNAGIKVLSLVLDGLMKNKLTSLPTSVSNMILDSKTRDRYCDEIVQNGQTNMLAMMNNVHQIEEIVTKQSTAIANGNKVIKFSQSPQIYIDPEDLQYTKPAPPPSKPFTKDEKFQKPLLTPTKPPLSNNSTSIQKPVVAKKPQVTVNPQNQNNNLSQASKNLSKNPILQKNDPNISNLLKSNPSQGSKGGSAAYGTIKPKQPIGSRYQPK